MKYLKNIKLFESVDVIDVTFSNIRKIKDTDLYLVKSSSQETNVKLEHTQQEIQNREKIIENIKQIFGELEVNKLIVTLYRAERLDFKILEEREKSIEIRIYEIQDEYYYVTIHKVLYDEMNGSVFFICDQFYGLIELLKYIKKILDEK